MCDICHDCYPNCPVCGDEYETEECILCNGIGLVFFDEYGEQLSNIEADNYINEGKWVGEETCPICNGEGTIKTN